MDFSTVKPVGVSPRFLLAVVAATLALLALEIAVRLTMVFDHNRLDELVERRRPVSGKELTLADLIRLNPNDRIVYDLRPDTHGRFLGHEISINSLGMRDVERSRTKPTGTFRILGLGDSHMFGWAVERDQTFLALLERSLNERIADRRFEVLNLAVPGYNTVQEVEVFSQRVDELEPDLVIIHYVDNDMDLPNFLAERPDLWTLRKSYLAQLARQRWVLLRGAAALPLNLVDAIQDERTLRFHPPAEDVPERYRSLYGWRNMVSAYQRLGHLAQERGVTAVLLINWDDLQPRLDGLTRNVLPRNIRRLAKACTRAGFLIVDPQDWLVRYLQENRLNSSALWISSSDSHTNPLRHRLVADALLEALIQAGALDPRKSSS